MSRVFPTAFANQFTPYNISQLPGVQLWLDAADPSSMDLTGNAVTAWRDKSGLSNNATIYNSVTFNAADRSVRTDGTNGYFTSPLDTRKTTSTYYNVFLVYRWLSSSSNTNQSLWGNDVGGGWNRFQLLSFPSPTGIAYGLSRGATSPNTTNISALNTANTLLYSANYAYNISNGSYAFVNGSQSINFTEVASNPETSTQLIFFGQLGSSQYFASIAFYEIIVCRQEISNDLRQVIEGYLAWKWSLQRNLPTTHPYYSTPFYAFPPFPITNFVPRATNRQVFLPTQISGCQLWLDAADRSTIQTSGTTLTSWSDKSGQTTTTLVSAPKLSGKYLNGYETILFNNNSITATIPTTIGTGDYCLFAVWIPYTSGTQGVLSIGPAATGNVGMGYNGDKFNLYCFGVSESIFSTATFNQYSVMTGQRLSGTITLYFNGNSNPSATGNNSISSTTIYVGNGTGFAINGEIAEVLVYPTTLSSQERQQIEGYLAWKWGLQASLPNTHAYYQAPTYTLGPFPSAPAVTRSTGKAFDPTKFTGCQLWFDATDRSTFSITGSNITQWRDKSSNAYSIAQATTSKQPFYITNAQNKLPGVQLATARWIFTETSNMPNFTTSSATSVFIAARNGTTGTTYNAINSVGIVPGGSALTARYQLYFDRGTGSLDRGVNLYLSGSFRLQDTTNIVPASTGGIVGFVASSSSILLSVNGNTSTTTGATPTSLNDSTYFQFGDSRENSSLSSDVMIFEMVGYSVVLTMSQRQEIEGYLAWKWGLQASLPQSHPWKLFPPPPN